MFLPGPFCEPMAFAWLIGKAAFKPMKIRLGKFYVPLDRGQVAASSRFLAGVWGWKESRVRRFLGRLSADAMVVVQADAGMSVITICNYDKYQFTPQDADALRDAQDDADATQTRRSSDANKKDVNNVKESLMASPRSRTSLEGKQARKRTEYPEHPRFGEFWLAMPKRSGTNSRKDASGKFSALIASGTDAEEIIRGARGYAAWCVKTGKAETEHVKQAITFLNGEHWKNFLMAEAKSADASPATVAYHAAFKGWVDGGRTGPMPSKESFDHLDREIAA